MDPNPIKHPAVLLARVRDSIEPTLLNEGFQFESRNSPRDPGRTHLWIDYVRGDDFISLRWDRWHATLSLELITSSEDFEMIACVSLRGCRSARELSHRMQEFVHQVISNDRLRLVHPPPK